MLKRLPDQIWNFSVSAGCVRPSLGQLFIKYQTRSEMHCIGNFVRILKNGNIERCIMCVQSNCTVRVEVNRNCKIDPATILHPISYLHNSFINWVLFFLPIISNICGFYISKQWIIVENTLLNITTFFGAAFSGIHVIKHNLYYWNFPCSQLFDHVIFSCPSQCHIRPTYKT